MAIPLNPAQPLPSFTRLVLILGTLTAVGALSIDMYLPAFPAMEAEFGGRPGTAQATLAAFFIGISIGQLVQGPLADRFGRRKPLLAGSLLYTLATIGCAVAPDATSFSAFRVLAAFGGSAGMVIPRAVVRDIAEGTAAARMMSRLVLVMGAAPILAPSLGGLALAFGNWRLIFWVLALYGVVCILLVWRALPETLEPARRRHDSPAGIVVTYVAILKDPSYLAPALSACAGFGGLFAYIAGASDAFMKLGGLSESSFAALFGLNAAFFIAFAQVNAWALGRASPARLIGWGVTALGVSAAALLAVALARIAHPLAIAAPVAAAMAALGFIGPNGTALALARQGHRAGSASALSGTMTFVFGAASAAVVALAADGTARPMALAVAFWSAVAVGADLWRRRLAKKRQKKT
ncbi:multidrug effflux MFS transporter [Elioraea rosea]|uniref:multidrug effflux MFS transporter n=1 Tax=Elioraea rosea TaxID=2492390 RepID=UPI001EF4A84D|nr:multidrug effflux MFS transporter [Elioraea rosea]